MAKLNEIWTPRHNAGLRAQFGMRGEAPAKQLAPEIQPTVELESVHWSPALQRSHHWHTFVAAAALQPVAGQFSSIWIGVDSRDIICELIALALGGGAVAFDIRQMPDPAMAVVGTVRDSDSRDPTFSQATPVPYPVILEAANSVAGAGGGPQQAGQIQVGNVGYLPVMYTLVGRAPSDPANGNGVLVQTNAFNFALSVVWVGRWRHVDPTERA